MKVPDLTLYEYKKLWEEECNADKTDKYNLVELMNQVQGKGKNCLEYWIEINSRAAEIELDSKTSTEIEQLLVMAVSLGGTTNQKLTEILWSAEYDFKKTDDEIKSHDKAEKQHADVRNLKGHTKIKKP